VAQLYPPAPGKHFSRLLRHARAAVGLFFSPVPTWGLQTMNYTKKIYICYSLKSTNNNAQALPMWPWSPYGATFTPTCFGGMFNTIIREFTFGGCDATCGIPSFLTYTSSEPLQGNCCQSLCTYRDSPLHTGRHVPKHVGVHVAA
jgi:hypothetical protein